MFDAINGREALESGFWLEAWSGQLGIGLHHSRIAYGPRLDSSHAWNTGGGEHLTPHAANSACLPGLCESWRLPFARRLAALTRPDIMLSNEQSGLRQDFAWKYSETAYSSLVVHCCIAISGRQAQASCTFASCKLSEAYWE